MKFLNKMVLFLVFISFMAAMGFSAEMRQKKNIEIIKITKEEKKGATRSAVRGGQSGANSAFNRAQWTKISAFYESSPEWSDEVQMKFYVLFLNKSPERKRTAVTPKDLYTMLTGSVKYINVPASRENRGEIFVHPNSLVRYGEIKEIRVEIWYKGVMESFMNQSHGISSKEAAQYQNWWTQIASKDGELLNRLYTPFVFDTDNSLEEIKVERA